MQMHNSRSDGKLPRPVRFAKTALFSRTPFPMPPSERAAAPDAANGAPADGAPERLPASLRAFLHGLVDYAGLFPPADLSLREAIQNYARYRQEDRAWMLSRFVIPVRRLPDLDEYARLFSQDARRARGEAPPYRFSVLGTGGETPEAFLDHFDGDLDAIEAFAERRQGRATADMMEVPLPHSLLEADSDAMEDFFESVHRRLVAAGTAQLDLYYEVPLTDETTETVPMAAQALAAHNARRERPLRAEACLKFRCGGDTAADFPAPGHLAHAIAACRDADTRFKATAGLHHPVRHRDDDLNTYRHGFLNVFGAAVLAEAQGLGPDALREVLLEENGDHFRFTPDALTWKDRSASTTAIEHTREHLAASFGSCSFEEPVEDLQGLGLLQ